MVDFTSTNDSLIETFATKRQLPDISLTPIKEKDESVLQPTVPNLNFDTTIPVEVQNSAAKQTATNKANRTAQRLRQNELGFLLDDAQDTINDAEDKIETLDNNPFGELIGLFSDDYDKSFQEKRIRQATRQVQTKVQTNKIQNANAAIDAADAGAELVNFQQMQVLKKQKFAMTSAESLAITQSNDAKKAQSAWQFGQMTMADMKEIKASGNFNEVATEQRIDGYFASIKKAQRLADTAAVALSQAKLDYSQDLENDILGDFPIQYLRDRLDASTAANEPVVTLGKNFKLAPAKIMKAISEKEKVAQGFRETEAKRAVQNAKNNIDFNSANRDMAVLSSDFTGGPNDVPLQNLNMMNITDDILSNVDVNKMHPGLAGEYLALLSFQNNLNSKKTGVTEQDNATRKELLKAFKDKSEKIKKAVIDSQPTKALKAAQNEWFSNGGRMQTGINASSVVAGNVSTMPDFAGDTALTGAWTAFAQNVVSDVSGETPDFTTA